MLYAFDYSACRLALDRGYNSLIAATSRLIVAMLRPKIHLMRSTFAVSMRALVSCRKASMSALVSCRKASMSAFGFLPQGFDVSLDGCEVGLGGEILFEQPCLLTHDGLGLALGHAGVHQLVDSRMRVKDQCGQVCHGLDHQDFFIPSPSTLSDRVAGGVIHDCHYTIKIMPQSIIRMGQPPLALGLVGSATDFCIHTATKEKKKAR